MACINFCFGFFYILIKVNCSTLLKYRNDVAPQLLFSDRTTIYILDLETGNPSVIATGYKWVSHIDYHKEKNLIFWTRGNTIESIAYPSMTDSTAKVVITYQINLTGFTVDSIHNHLYWISISGIYRSDLDGYSRKSILRGYGQDLELDIANGWIYIMKTRLLEKCRFDGTEKQAVHVGPEISTSTVLDPEDGRIYWNEHKRIRSALLNASDIRTEYNVSSLGGTVNDLDISQSHIYFTIPTKGQLYKIPKNSTLADISLLYSTTSIKGLKIYKNRSGPCNQYYVIRNEEKRSPEYITDQSIDDTISDVLLNDNWYRIISKNGDEMPTYPPGLFHCGTVKPVWLNGSLPTIEEKNVTREACLQTFNDTCKEKIAINIVNCWNRFYVYQLPNTTTNSGYCFGRGPVSCADGFSSETGFFPGCSSLFPNETVLPFVKGVLIDGPVHNVPNYNSTPSLLSAFKCDFDETTENSYVYDIHWYINGDSIKVAKNVPYDNINGILKDSDWKDHYHMNMEVTCAVRIRTSVGSVPSPFFKSEVYKAGLYPEKYDYVVIEGDHVNIHFTSTVPVGCKGTHPDIRSNCYQNVYIYLQKNDTDEPIKCYNNIVSRDIVFRTKFCGIRVGNLDWKEKKQLQVYGFSDGLYNSQDRSTVIKVSTTSLSTVNQIWNNLTIPDIKVTVRDKDYALRSRLCQSYNDPHIKTFDGRLYHYMDVGEYVIYRNDRGPYWVHALFTNCVSGWVGASCHCGIAIRSRQSLFVLRTCEKISRKEVYLLKHPLTEIRTCVDSDLSVKTTGNTYTVTLPIGTEIKFTVASYTSFITMISVKPSIYDVKEARGLCGVPSVTKDPSDDFHHREQGPIHDDQEFARSWKILLTTTPNEQLFLPSPHFLTEDSNTDIENDNQNSTDIENDNQNNTDIENDNQSSNFSTGMYCICEKQAEPNDEDFYASQCSLSDSTEYCPSDTQSKPGNEILSNPVATTCTSNMQNSSRSHRTRRSVTDSDDIVLDHLPLEYDDDVNDTVPELDFRDEWTEEKANKTCTERIKKSIPSEIPNVPGLSEYDYIQSCMLDIKITAGTTFIGDTIGAIQTKAIMELSRNQTLLNTKTDNNGSQTILDYVKSLLCPNNCSGNGTCVSGVCSCFDGYTGDDCSEEMSKPPSNIEIPANGLCGTRTRACRRTNVYGTFNSKTVWCRRRHFQIHKGSYEFTSVNDVVYADYRNLFMISVDLQSSRRKRSVSGNLMAEGFELSFSNDGQEFGNSGTVIIYDEQCFTCNATSKDCYPVITCPEPPETVRDIVKFSSNTKYVIIGTSCAVLFLAIIVILVFLKIRNVKSRMKIRTMKEDNTPET